MSEHKEYCIDYYFDVDLNNEIKYEMHRWSRDIDSLLSYVYDWIDKCENKYGEIFGEINCVEIYDEFHDELFLVVHFFETHEEIVRLQPDERK